MVDTKGFYGFATQQPLKTVRLNCSGITSTKEKYWAELFDPTFKPRVWPKPIHKILCGFSVEQSCVDWVGWYCCLSITVKLKKTSFLCWRFGLGSFDSLTELKYCGAYSWTPITTVANAEFANVDKYFPLYGAAMFFSLPRI